MKLKRVLILTKSARPESRLIAERLAKMASARGIKHSIEISTNKPPKSKDKADLVIGVGGDGTMLRALRWIKDSTPLLGIKVGGRGALSELGPEQLGIIFDRIERDEFYLDKRSKYQVKLNGKPLFTFVNEAYVFTTIPTRTPTYKIHLTDETFTIRMDGCIIASATGSTGHSYSLGGPVLASNMESMILTPIAPLTRFPSIVTSSLPIRLTSTSEFTVVLDGQLTFPARAKESLEILRADQSAVFMRFSKGSFVQLRKVVQG
jgi:NAD+ kinase